MFDLNLGKTDGEIYLLSSVVKCYGSLVLYKKYCNKLSKFHCFVAGSGFGLGIVFSGIFFKSMYLSYYVCLYIAFVCNILHVISFCITLSVIVYCFYSV